MCNKSALGFLCVSVSLWLAPPSPAAELLGTKPLEIEGNLSEKQVAWMHKYLDRELDAAAKNRDLLWKKLGKEEKHRTGLTKMLGRPVSGWARTTGWCAGAAARQCSRVSRTVSSSESCGA